MRDLGVQPQSRSLFPALFPALFSALHAIPVLGLVLICGVVFGVGLSTGYAETEAGHEEGPHATVSAAHEADHEHHAGAGHESHHRYQVGFSGVTLATVSGGEVSLHSGGGIFFEISAIPGWLEVELSLHALSAEGGVEMPIDLLLKKPFHINRWFHPFVGVGPTMVPAFLPEDISVHFGGASAIGAHFWLTSHLGILAEVNYNLIADHGAVHEIGGAAGLVIGD